MRKYLSGLEQQFWLWLSLLFAGVVEVPGPLGNRVVGVSYTQRHYFLRVMVQNRRCRGGLYARPQPWRIRVIGRG